MLSPYCQTVLKAELAKSDYDGKSADQGWSWLMDPTPQPPLVRPSGLMLTPVTFAKLVGAVKAEAVAAAMKAAYPTVADHLMTEGLDPQSQEVQAFLANLVSGNVLSTADASTVAAAATTTTPQPELPRRFDRRFDPQAWPHVDPDGNPSADAGLPAIHGFPNDLGRDDFNAAWSAAGRN